MERIMAEDNRDIFDKALENVPAAGAVGGVVLGGMAGMRSIVGRKTMRAFKKAELGEKLTSSDIALLNRADKRMLPAGLVGGTAGLVAGGYAGSKAQSNLSRKRK